MEEWETELLLFCVGKRVRRLRPVRHKTSHFASSFSSSCSQTETPSFCPHANAHSRVSGIVRLVGSMLPAFWTLDHPQQPNPQVSVGRSGNTQKARSIQSAHKSRFRIDGRRCSGQWADEFAYLKDVKWLLVHYCVHVVLGGGFTVIHLGTLLTDVIKSQSSR
jgi:hypothetical protein